jgi:C4-dicarboxylate transporter
MPSFLLMFLKAKLVAHLFLIWLVCAYPLGMLRDFSTFTVHRNFKVSPSARRVSAANAVCRSIDIFNKDCILLADVSELTK